MKLMYDKEVDILLITLSSEAIIDSDEIAPGVVADYDEKENIVSIEIQAASKRVESLTEVEYKQRIPESLTLIPLP